MCAARNVLGMTIQIGRQSKAQSSDEPESQSGVSARYPVVGHDAKTAGQKFGAPRRKRLPNIEDAKKYKSRQQIFPVQQSGRESGRDLCAESHAAWRSGPGAQSQSSHQ